MQRIIYIDGGFDQYLGDSVIEQMELYDTVSNEDIYVVIDSYGGSVPAMLAMYAASRKLKSDIVTITVGKAMSAGAFVLLGMGAKGKRYSFPNSHIMLHEVRGVAEQSFAGIKPMQKYNDRIFSTLSEAFGRPAAEIRKDFQRDVYMWPEEAIEAGWIDGIFQPSKLKDI